MMSLHHAFTAGFVRRWHSNPELAHTNDRCDAHSGRVARILLMWHPAPSIDLIAAALRHDDGELAVGDMKAPLKTQYPEIAKALDEVEANERIKIWGCDDSLKEADQTWMNFADRLDAFMWASHHKANMNGDGWPGALVKLHRQADILGCSPHLIQLIADLPAPVKTDGVIA